MKTSSLGLILGLALLAVLSGGCIIRSLFPFYSDSKVAFEQAVPAGTWTVTEAPMDNYKKFKPWRAIDGKLTTYDENGRSSILKMTFFRIAETLFVDIFPEDESNVSNGFAGVVLVPTHTLCKVTTVTAADDKHVVFTPLNFGYMKDALEAGSVKLPFVKQKDDEYVFTATTEQWQQFLSGARNSETAFDPKQNFVFAVDEVKK